MERPGDGKADQTIIVTDANMLTAQIHARMPVILNPSQFHGWLSGEASADVLKSAPEDALRMWPVSRRVNSSRADDSDRR
jgi:putative SOS response-associated peptidase YedK